MRKATPYLLLAPALLFTAFILLYPLVQNILNSLHYVTLAGGSGGIANTKPFPDAMLRALSR